MKEPGKLTREIAARLVTDMMLVDEGDIEQAIVMLLEIEKTVVEGAGAASLAAILREPERFRGRKVGLVLCGGNIDPLMLAEIVERGMVRAGRLARVRVEVRDLPGALAKVTACLAELNANIEEVHHQRAFTHLAVAARRGGPGPEDPQSRPRRGDRGCPHRRRLRRARAQCRRMRK